jgi:hypothetical protein
MELIRKIVFYINLFFNSIWFDVLLFLMIIVGALLSWNGTLEDYGIKLSFLTIF